MQQEKWRGKWQPQEFNPYSAHCDEPVVHEDNDWGIVVEDNGGQEEASSSVRAMRLRLAFGSAKTPSARTAGADASPKHDEHVQRRR